jgi:predicted nucleic acid-binding protein
MSSEASPAEGESLDGLVARIDQAAEGVGSADEVWDRLRLQPSEEGSATALVGKAFLYDERSNRQTDSAAPHLAEFIARQKAEQQRAEELRGLVQGMVRHFHLYNTTEAIRLPDADGVFPATTLWRASLVVVDANTLRNDIIYACRHEGTPTTLVNGANSQMLRLFCARHVLEELHEHYREWCEEEDVPVTKFVKHFKTSYAPLLRAVRQVPDGLLSTEEQDRVEVLGVDDPDDIPSVTLALLLRAFYMSEDLKACRAVYGREFSSDEVRAWREVLSAGGDAGVVGSLFQVGAMLTGALGMGVWGLFDKLTGSLNPWIRLLIAGVVIGGGGYLYQRMPEKRRDGVRNGLGQALNVATAFSAEHVAATTRMNRALPAAPIWERLAGEQQRRNVLTRACLHTLGRAQGHLSAVELAELLPGLGVGQSAPLVRQVLYKYPGCFESVYSGRWQVGTALVRAPRDLDEAS